MVRYEIVVSPEAHMGTHRFDLMIDGEKAAGFGCYSSQDIARKEAFDFAVEFLFPKEARHD